MLNKPSEVMCQVKKDIGQKVQKKLLISFQDSLIINNIQKLNIKQNLKEYNAKSKLFLKNVFFFLY